MASSFGFATTDMLLFFEAAEAGVACNKCCWEDCRRGIEVKVGFLVVVVVVVGTIVDGDLLLLLLFAFLSSEEEEGLLLVSAKDFARVRMP